MNRVKKQHFVPQFYLRGFAPSGALFVFDKTTQRVFRSAVENAACETYFYDIPEVDNEIGIDQFIEHFFQPVEGAAAKALGDILDRRLSGTLTAITDAERGDLAIHLALQTMRTREARIQHIEMHTKVIEMRFRAFLEANHSDLAGADLQIEANKEIEPALHAMVLLNPDLMEQMAWILFRHIWVLAPNPTGAPLMTSDHPVVKQPHEKHPLFSTNGYGSVGIEIAFPLAPDLLLLLYDRVRFGEHLEAADGKVVGPLAEANVLFYNSLQVRDSARFLYSAFENFEVAKEMCVAHPELTDPDRDRIVVDGMPGRSSAA